MKIRIFVLALLCVCVSGVHAQLNTWISQNPPNLSGVYRAIQSVSATTTYIVGDKGNVTKTSDGGQTFTGMTIGSQNLFAVSFIDSLTGMTVGASGAAYKTTDGGATWKALKTNAGSNESLYGVLMADSNLALICGGTSNSNGTVRISRDGGATWAPYAGELSLGYINSIRMLRPGFIVFVGNNGAFSISHDSARTFTSYNVYPQNDINDICFFDDQHAVAVGGPGKYIIATTNGGLSWTLQDTNNFTVGGLTLNHVDSKGASSVVAVGDHGQILYSTNGGATWSKSYFGASTSIKGISMFSTSIGMVVGQDGVIMRTTDGGANWDFVPRKPETATLRAVQMMPDSRTGFAAGSYGTVLVTADSGHTWLPVSLGTNTNFYGSAMDTAGKGYIVGERGTIMKTTDVGRTWLSLPVPTTKNVRAITIASPSGKAVYAVGDSALFLRSTDAGAYWTAYRGPLPDSISITSISFFDSSRGLIASPNGIYLTSDAGISWQMVVPTTDVIMTAVATGTSRSHAYAIGIFVPDFTGVIEYSSDGGHTWNGSGGTAFPKLLGVFTSDGYHATVVGKNGGVLHTTDPTVAWQTQSTTTSNDLFNVNFGTIHAGWSVGFRGTILRIDTDEEMDVRNPTAASMPHTKIDRVYPNPAVNRVHLTYTLDRLAPTTIELFSMLGTRLASYELGMQTDGTHTGDLTLPDMANGTYLLVLSSGGATSTERIVVSH